MSAVDRSLANLVWHLSLPHCRYTLRGLTGAFAAFVISRDMAAAAGAPSASGGSGHSEPLPCRLLVAPEVLLAAQGELDAGGPVSGSLSSMSSLRSRLEKGSTREKERALEALISTLALESDVRARQELTAT